MSDVGKNSFTIENVSKELKVRKRKTIFKTKDSDLVVGCLSMILALIFSVNLWRCFSQDWIHNKALRWEIVGLGFALLVDSACVCLYVYKRNQSRQRSTPPVLRQNNSQLQLILQSADLPSYDSLNIELPPSYYSLFVENEKVVPQKSITNTG